MSLPTSGRITLSQIAAEFGGAHPILMSRYYKGGILVPIASQNTTVPTSGAIKVSNFYGATRRTMVNFGVYSNTANAYIDVSTINGYVAGISDIRITVANTIMLYSANAGNPAMTIRGGVAGDTITLVNNGYIIGMNNGGTALDIGFTTTIDQTNPFAIIGGGGGNGGKGGNSSATVNGSGAGGAGGEGGNYTHLNGYAGGAGVYNTNGGGGGAVGSVGGNGDGRGGDKNYSGGGGGGGGLGAAGGTGGAGFDGGGAGGNGGGRAINLNGNGLYWVAGNSQRVYGAVS